MQDYGHQALERTTISTQTNYLIINTLLSDIYISAESFFPEHAGFSQQT
jgi:hypothetical protein